MQGSFCILNGVVISENFGILYKSATSRVCVCIYIYIFMHMCVYVYIYIYTYTYIHTYISAYTCVCMWVCNIVFMGVV